MPHAVKAFSFRRGTYPAAIHCLTFSPEGYDPPLLAAASGHGSIHVFRLEAPQRSAAAVAASAAAGLLSAVMNYNVVSDMVRGTANKVTRCLNRVAQCVEHAWLAQTYMKQE